MRVTCRIGESGDLEGLLDQTIETRVTVASRLCLSPLALYSHCERANTRPLGLSYSPSRLESKTLHQTGLPAS